MGSTVQNCCMQNKPQPQPKYVDIYTHKVDGRHVLTIYGTHYYPLTIPIRNQRRKNNVINILKSCVRRRFNVRLWDYGSKEPVIEGNLTHKFPTLLHWISELGIK